MTAQKSLYVGEFGCENFKRLSMYSFRALGRHVKISGKNGAGKSTAMDILKSVLGLIPGKELSEPIKSGSTRAKSWVDLCDADGTIVWKAKETWTEKGSTIDLRKADGSKQPRPRETLESLYLPFAFSPSSWINQRPQDQLDDVLRVYGVTAPVDQVAAITGESIRPQEGESASRYLDRLSADERGLYYVRRREAKRVWDVKAKAFEEFRPHLDAADGPEPDISALLAEQVELDAKLQNRRELTDKAEAAKRLHDEKAAKLAALKAELEKEKKQIDDIQAQIRMFEDKLQLALRTKQATESMISLGEERVPELTRAYEAAQFVAVQSEDPLPRIQEVRTLIQTADKDRKAIAERKQARETAERLQVEAGQAEREHVKVDSILEALRELRRNLLNGIDLGIDGLAIGDGELRYMDAPFVQASTGQRLIVACAIIMAQHPTAKFLIFDDAEKLDDDNEAKLIDMANRKGWQLFLIFVDRSKAEINTQIIDETAAELAVAT